MEAVASAREGSNQYQYRGGAKHPTGRVVSAATAAAVQPSDDDATSAWLDNWLDSEAPAPEDQPAEEIDEFVWSYTSDAGEEFTLTAGNVDRDVDRVFCLGQCHALAIALHAETGWPLRAVHFDENGAGVGVRHVGVETPSGMFLDIQGEHDPAALAERGEPVLPVRRAEVEMMATGQYPWTPPILAAAVPFAEDLLVEHGYDG